MLCYIFFLNLSNCYSRLWENCILYVCGHTKIRKRCIEKLTKYTYILYLIWSILLVSSNILRNTKSVCCLYMYIMYRGWGDGILDSKLAKTVLGSSQYVLYATYFLESNNWLAFYVLRINTTNKTIFTSKQYC